MVNSHAVYNTEISIVPRCGNALVRQLQHPLNDTPPSGVRCFYANTPGPSLSAQPLSADLTANVYHEVITAQRCQ